MLWSHHCVTLAGDDTRTSNTFSSRWPCTGEHNVQCIQSNIARRDARRPSRSISFWQGGNIHTAHDLVQLARSSFSTLLHTRRLRPLSAWLAIACETAPLWCRLQWFQTLRCSATRQPVARPSSHAVHARATHCAVVLATSVHRCSFVPSRLHARAVSTDWTPSPRSRPRRRRWPGCCSRCCPRRARAPTAATGASSR